MQVEAAVEEEEEEEEEEAEAEQRGEMFYPERNMEV